jgi:parallel beta-helix repeat protein
VINSGKGHGVIIENSVNVQLKDNVIADQVRQGIWVKTSDSITIDGNWVHHILPDDDDPPVINQWPILGDYEIGGITASQGN